MVSLRGNAGRVTDRPYESGTYHVRDALEEVEDLPQQSLEVGGEDGAARLEGVLLDVVRP